MPSSKHCGITSAASITCSLRLLLLLPAASLAFSFSSNCGGAGLHQTSQRGGVTGTAFIGRVGTCFRSALPSEQEQGQRSVGNRILPASTAVPSPRTRTAVLLALSKDGSKSNKDDDPYGDVDYTSQPLEFVDYSDPNYSVDQGLVEGEEGYNQITDEQLLESMREDRRRRNDEFQFETYFRDAWKDGAEYLGEWTTYASTTFLEGFDDAAGASAGGYPNIVKAKKPSKVISSASKVMVNPDAEWRGDIHVIRHVEYEVTNEATEPTLTVRRDTDTDSGFGRHDEEDEEEGGDSVVGEGSGGSSGSRTQLDVRYWPEEMTSRDFRGHQGNMCVGNAYTICDAIKLFDDGSEDDDDDHDGPFSELRAEVGIHGEDLRMRVKLEYRVKMDDNDAAAASSPPPLLLSSMTVCRERREEWPSPHRDVALFGSAGANGGLYDPPPVGTDEQATRYMALDLEGGATVLFPHSIDQHHPPENGWVFSLDWTPGSIRYQVDRKFMGGTKLKGLKTLELSEVEALESESWRPRNGPADMRQ